MIEAKEFNSFELEDALKEMLDWFKRNQNIIPNDIVFRADGKWHFKVYYREHDRMDNL
jgi:hypothetical protein